MFLFQARDKAKIISILLFLLFRVSFSISLFNRIREKQLNEKMEKAMDNLKADHIRESQELVMQFNEAQEILKDKISELQIQ